MAMLQSKEIEDVFLESRDYPRVISKRKKLSHHAIPAVNSRIADSLLKRSKLAYKHENYLVSALLASEALEILNGLSASLSLSALQLKSIAEAQMELGVVGLNSFKGVIKKKIFEIRRQIKRICGENPRAERNGRMQIFSQLRHIFEENQQFDTAEDLYEEVLKAEFELNDVNEIQLKAKVKMKKEKDQPPDTGKQTPTPRYKYVLSSVLRNFYFYYLLVFSGLLVTNIGCDISTIKIGYNFSIKKALIF